MNNISEAKKALFEGDRLEVRQQLQEVEHDTAEVLWLKANSIIDDSGVEISHDNLLETDKPPRYGSFPDEMSLNDGSHINLKLDYLHKIQGLRITPYSELAHNIIQHEQAYQNEIGKKGFRGWFDSNLEMIHKAVVFLLAIFISAFIFILLLSLLGG